MRIEYHHSHDSTHARREQSKRVVFLEHKDYTALNTLTSVTAKINTGCVRSPAPSLSAPFSDQRYSPVHTNFPSGANLQSRMKNVNTSVLFITIFLTYQARFPSPNINSSNFHTKFSAYLRTAQSSPLRTPIS